MINSTITTCATAANAASQAGCQAPVTEVAATVATIGATAALSRVKGLFRYINGVSHDMVSKAHDFSTKVGRAVVTKYVEPSVTSMKHAGAFAMTKAHSYSVSALKRMEPITIPLVQHAGSFANGVVVRLAAVRDASHIAATQVHVLTDTMVDMLAPYAASIKEKGVLIAVKIVGLAKQTMHYISLAQPALDRTKILVKVSAEKTSELVKGGYQYYLKVSQSGRDMWSLAFHHTAA